MRGIMFTASELVIDTAFPRLILWSKECMSALSSIFKSSLSTYFPSGINRLTQNFDLAFSIIDDAFRTTDKEAVAMSRYLVMNDGLFLGSSSACNLVACIRLAKKMRWKDGQVIVTVLYVSPLLPNLTYETKYCRCDSGSRHYSKVRDCNMRLLLSRTHFILFLFFYFISSSGQYVAVGS